ncbi:MAG: ATP-binding protein [bacterium]|nr:ATP-binding protein [bacterium]
MKKLPLENLTTTLDQKERQTTKYISQQKYNAQKRMLSALKKTSEALALATDAKLILEKIATALGKSLGAKYVNFWEFTPDKKGLFITAAYGMQRQYLVQSKKHPITLGTAWVGRAVATKKVWATSDVQTDPKLPSSWLPAVKKQAYHGVLCLPLMKKGEALGGMCIYYKQIHEFDYFEMALATITANQAATAMANAKLFSELLAEKNKTIATIQSLKDGLIIYDLGGKVMFFNHRAEEYLWLRAKDVIGKNFAEKDTEQNVYLKNFYNISKIVQTEYSSKEFTTDGPQKLVLEITQVPINDQYQKIGVMQILRDITKEKDLEIMKSGFVATASHQLRTPLSGTKWALDLLARGDAGELNEEQKSIVNKLLTSNQALINLVNDLLDISRIDEGKFGYEFVASDLIKLAQQLYEQTKNDAARKNLNYIFMPPDFKLPPLKLDPAKLAIAIRNLLDNAIKYTPDKGKVTIYFRLEEKTAALLVQDTGIGIPEKDRKFISVKFFRAPNAIKFQTEGSGLGLYIAKSIIEKHNAALDFETEEKIGSTFIIRFVLPEKK